MPTLDVADDDFWLTWLGVVPQASEVSGDDFVQELRVPISESEELHVTWDITADSVRIRYRLGDEIVVDVLRELATLLTVEVIASEKTVVLEYSAEGAHGRTLFRVAPSFAMSDSFLKA